MTKDAKTASLLATQDGVVCLYWWKVLRPFHATEPGGVAMDFAVDAGQQIRLHTADRSLLVQEQLDVLAGRRDAGASDAELAELVAELLRLRDR